MFLGRRGPVGQGRRDHAADRYNEWNAHGAFDALVAEAIEGYDRIVGVDLSEASVDASLHKAPSGGDGTGKSPVDRGESGWKWSLLCDRAGIPVSWAADGANRNDQVLLEPTLAAADQRGLLCDVETLHLDRGYAGTRCVASVRAMESTTSCEPPNADEAAAPEDPRPCPWGCAGPSSAPTRGCRTSGNYGAAPTATPKHASDNSPRPSP